MKMPKATPWVLGAAVVSVLILGLAWMFGISPQLETANQARDDAERVEMQNVQHQRRLVELRQQFENLDEYKAELAAIQVQLPPEDGEPSLYREIAQASATSGAFIVSIITEAVTSVEPTPEADPNAGATEPGADEAADGSGGEAADETPPATVEPTPMGLDGFVAVPFSIKVLGTYDQTVQFVELVQESFQRLFVVTGFTVKGQAASPPAGGRPEVKEGDAEFEILGFVYVLQDDGTQTAGDEADADEGDATVDS